MWSHDQVFSLISNRAMAGDTSLSSHYAFCGMHHIFDTHRDAVTVIKFGHDDRTCLACGSMDSTVSIFSIVPEPPTLKCTLRGHSKGVVGKAPRHADLAVWYNDM